MRGLILCGGQDLAATPGKGELTFAAADWAQTAFDKMAGFLMPVNLSVHAAQYSEYATVFTAEQLIQTDASINAIEPLPAILTAHAKYPREDLFVLGCQLRQMETYLLEQLYSDYQKQTAGVYVFSHGFEYEPWCGIYTANTLSAFNRLYKKNQLARQSLQALIKQANPFAVPIAGDQKKYFIHAGN